MDNCGRSGRTAARSTSAVNGSRRIAASEVVQADEARLRRATHHLLERLMDVERAELQRMRNSTVIDSLVARRLQRDLDLLRLRDRI